MTRTPPRIAKRSLPRFLALPGADRHALVQALVAVAAIRLALWTLPFRVIRPVIGRLAARRCGAGLGADDLRRVAWAVTAAAARIPHATCLTQALAARVLLAGGREHATVRLGVARRPGAPAPAHAWLEYRGQVVVGGAGRERYMPLPFLDGLAGPVRSPRRRTASKEKSHEEES